MNFVFSYQLLILAAIIFLPMLCAVVVAVLLFRRDRRGRRSPLSRNLLRGAGETIRAEIDNISEKIDDFLTSILLTSVSPLAMLLLLNKTGNGIITVWKLVLVFVVYGLLLYWVTRRLYSLLQQRRNLYLGLDAELAIGQELNHLMLEGCRVFHDFPAENFNIDHVVAGPGGVFAVETKGRTKPDQGRGKEEAKVVYDGKILRFPDWQEVEPLDQAKRQATWLQKWLRDAVAEAVTVRPVLALPGWFIERTAPGNVLVINGKNPGFLARPQGAAERLPAEMIQRISHQLEQRCRDVEPVAYKRQKRR
jgi:hypothetical protein